MKTKVRQGFVTLNGEVAWCFRHDEAARSIRSLSGVTGIANQITIKRRPDTTKVQDDVGYALRRSWLSDDPVEVSARDGEVHLTGSVESWGDPNIATNSAWHASGTTSVVNDFRVI